MPTPPFFNLLNALESINDAEKYSAFHTINTGYKTSIDGNFHITADILIPHTLRNTQYQGPRPVIVRIHGGFLVRYHGGHLRTNTKILTGNGIKLVPTVVQQLDPRIRVTKQRHHHLP